MTRDNRFDIVKAILIFLVVFGHTTRVGSCANGMTRVIEYIYVFHVWIFFFLSGYFLSIERMSLRRIGTNLFLPYLYTGILYYVASWVYQGSHCCFYDWAKSFIFNSAGGSSWFLCVIIWLNLILLVCYKLKSHRFICLFVTVCLVFFYKKFVCIGTQDVMFLSAMCFLIGLFIHGRNIADFLIALAPMSIILLFFIGIGRVFAVADFLCTAEVEWIVRFLALSSFIGIANVVNKYRMASVVLGYVGRHTLIIFLVHSLFNRPLFPFLSSLCAFDKSGIVFQFINPLLIIAICLAISCVLSKCKTLWIRKSMTLALV